MPQVGIVATNRHDVHALLATLKLACNRRHRAPSSTRKRARHRRRHVVHLFVPVHASGSTTDVVVSDDDAVSPALVLDSATVDVLRGCGIDVGKWTDLRWWSVRHGEWRDRTVALSSSSSSFSVLTASGIMSSQELPFSSNNNTFKVVTEQRLLDALWMRVRACRNVTVHACDGAHVDAVDVDEFDNRDELNNDTNAGIIEQLRIERARSTIGNERRASTTTYAITAVSHVDGTSRRFHFDWVVASSGTSASSLSSSNCIRPWTSAMSARTSAKSALRGGRYFVRAFVEVCMCMSGVLCMSKLTHSLTFMFRPLIFTTTSGATRIFTTCIRGMPP